MFKQIITVLTLTLTACGYPEVTACDVTTREQADQQRQECATNFAEIIPVGSGFVAYCVPNSVSEACLDQSGSIDCSDINSSRCQLAMVAEFERCLADSLARN